MDRSRLDELLASVLNITESDGDRHTYFNPPSTVKMKYPAIRYTLGGIIRKFANDGSYHMVPYWEITLIDRNPDSVYVKKILQIPYCRFDRFYKADNINHWTFTIYN